MFWAVVSLDFFLTQVSDMKYSNTILRLSPQFSDTKYSELIQRIPMLLYDFKYPFVISIIIKYKEVYLFINRHLFAYIYTVLSNYN